MTISDEQLDRLVYLLTYGWLDAADDGDDAAYRLAFQETVPLVDSPVELHCLAANVNWDDGFAGLRAIMEHERCDRGTVLMLYWLAEPTCQPYDDEGLAFLQELELRYRDLPPGKIAFTPPTSQESFSDARREVPAQMLQSQPGDDLTNLVEAVRLVITLAWYAKGSLSQQQLVATFDFLTPQLAEGFRTAIRPLRNRLGSIGGRRGSPTGAKEVREIQRAVLAAAQTDCEI